MGRLSNLLLSRREFFRASGVAVTSVAAASGCVKATGSIIDIAAKTNKKEKLPVVVVGAGIGSLTAAAYLAKAGFPVTVVEQHHIPGGYATSFDRASGRFIFEVSLHMVSVHGSATETVLRELGLSEKVALARLPELCRIVCPDYDIVLPQSDPEGCVRAFSKIFPDEENGIRGFIDEMVGVAKEIDRMKTPMSLADKLFFPFRYPCLRRTYNATLADMLDRYVKERKLKSLLSVFWGCYGLPPSVLSGFYYTVATGQFIGEGTYCYNPRSQALSNAFGELIEQCGGRMIFNQAVDQILLTKDTVSGARLQGGEILPARAVISGASGPSTFHRLLPRNAVSEKYQKKLDGLRPSISSFVVWLGLSRDVRGRLPNYEIILLGRYDHDDAYRAQLRCDAGRAEVMVTLFDNAFDGYSAPGTSTMSIMFLCGYKPWKRFETDYFAGRKEAYNKEKSRIALEIIDRVERSVLPGLSSMIEVMETATPLTNLRYTQNPAGAIYGYEQTMDNSFIKRIENRTPVKGLYLASAWGFPGGGFCGAHTSGRGAFQNFLEDYS
jgi:phytoene dehydrogenase-like protein